MPFLKPQSPSRKPKTFARTAFLALALASRLYSAEPPLPAAPEVPKGVTSVPFNLFADHIFIPVQVNGQECQCAIDTGSEMTLLNQHKVPLKHLRLGDTETLQGDFVGGLFSMRYALLDTLAIGDNIQKQVRVGVINHGPGQKLEQVEMLLGMDFLAQRRFTLDFTNHRFLLWPAHSELPRAPATVERVRLATQSGRELDDRRPRVLGLINQKTKAAFLIDSGTASLMFVAVEKLEAYGLTDVGDVFGLRSINEGNTSRQLQIFNVTFAALGFDKMSFAQVPGRVLDASTVANVLARTDLVHTCNIIGVQFLQTLSAIHFDPPARAVYLERLKPLP